MENLIGSKIKRIFFNEDYLKFETDNEDCTYTVKGDCCSNSLFYDFFGVKKLLENGPVTEVKEIELNPTDIIKEKIPEWSEGLSDKKSSDSSIKVYGFAITTVSEEFGEMTSVVSFRNYSNGYYGGYMESVPNKTVLPEIFDDVLESAEALKD